jgi:type I restriction enzyme S subunit
MKVGKVQYNTICNDGFTMKPNFHLNFGKFRLFNYVNKGGNYSTLVNEVSNIHRPGIFKRMFVKKEDFGYKYITASNMMEQDSLSSAKNISKKFTPWVDAMTLRDTEILVSCAGTVGNVRLITKELENVIGSQDIIRVVPFKHNYGYIYAYLSSPTCYNYLQSLIYGSVVTRLDPKALEKIPIPLLPEKQQEEIHQLIVDAAQLRVEANRLLGEVVAKIEKGFEFNSDKKIISVNIKEINKGDKYTNEARLEADFYSVNAKKIIQQIQINNSSYLGDLATMVNRSGLRERTFVSDGIPLITGQNLNLNSLRDLKKLSRKFTRNIEKNTTSNSDILISVLGTIGKIEYVFDNIYKNVFASEQLTKVKIDPDLIHPGYVFAFLKSKLGQAQLLKFKTGSVIEWIIEHNIKSVLIPIPEDKGHSIGEQINKLTLQRQEAYQKETQAIQLIENEISTWQV